VKPADSITIPYLIVVLALMPVLGVRSWFRLKSGKPLPSKNRRYLAMIVLQILLLAGTSLVARQNNISLFGPAWPPAWAWATVVAYLILFAVRTRSGWHKVSEDTKRQARLILPETPIELGYWIPISLLAGVSEEYAYRGVAFIMLSQIAGLPFFSVIVCVLAFGIAHMMQGWRGARVAMLMAIMFHAIVFRTQSLALVMAFHVAYDLTIGILAMQAFMRDNVTNAAGIPAASSS
jgi:membrane protease YdiL (CAAX protease family)